MRMGRGDRHVTSRTREIIRGALACVSRATMGLTRGGPRLTSLWDLSASGTEILLPCQCIVATVACPGVRSAPLGCCPRPTASPHIRLSTWGCQLEAVSLQFEARNARQRLPNSRAGASLLRSARRVGGQRGRPGRAGLRWPLQAAHTRGHGVQRVRDALGPVLLTRTLGVHSMHEGRLFHVPRCSSVLQPAAKVASELQIWWGKEKSVTGFRPSHLQKDDKRFIQP